MTFDIKKSEIFRALRKGKTPLLRFAKILSIFFAFFVALSLVMIALSLLGNVASRVAVKYLVFSLSFYFLFYNLNLFFNIKVKNPKLINKENLADSLDYESAKIVEQTIKFCRKRKLQINSTSLFYSAVKNNKDISTVVFRLGIDGQKLQDEFKNYLEKTPRQDLSGVSFADDFINIMSEALAVSAGRQHERIDVMDIFVSLARNNDFFKKILVEYDLKKEDVENITLWMESLEKSLKRSKEFWSRENLEIKGSLGKDFATGYTVNLDRFSIDWRKVVSGWAFREIIGHEKEIEQVEMGLAKSENANVLIIGDTGAGRKSIIQSLAQKCYLGESLPELNNKRVVELDVITLDSTIGDSEKLEATLDQIFFEVVSAGNVILVIDNLENFVSLKEQKPGQVDLSAILSKYLSMPNFPFVGITSYDGLHKNIEENSSFAEFFKKVEVQEISETETIRILQNAALEAEYKHRIFISYPAIREIVNLTGRYIPSMTFPKKALDILDEAVVYVQTLKEKVILPHHIAEIISKKTEIPVGKMEVKEKEVLMNLENLIHKRLVNQEEAVKEISIAMRRARSGLSSKKRPMGSFLFLGPTGVGKTETAKALAQIYFGSEEKMIRIDMSEFQSVSDIPRLIGQSSPVELQGAVTTQVRESPFSLVLLDEIEKAYPDILNLFLQVLDEGHITDGQGRKVVFANTIIICTSNAGSPNIFKAIEAGETLNKDKILEDLFDKKVFRPEFVNRFDATVIFHPLTKDNLMKIAQLSLESLQKNLKEKEIDFIITEHLKEEIVRLSYKPSFGAREMRRVIQDKVENIIAEGLISDKIKKGDKIEINADTFEVVINPVK